MKRATLLLATLVLLLGGVGQAGADTIYDTTGSWNGIQDAIPWGPVESATPTYGQTFYAPAVDDVLQNFTFYIGAGDGQTVTFQADVYAWSGSLLGGNSPQGSTGSPVFTSPDMTITRSGPFQPVTVDTGGVALTPGAPYVALFTTSDPGSIAVNAVNINQEYTWGLINGSHVSNDGGGGFGFYNNTASSQLSAGPWGDSADLGDLAWRADFSSSAVPEPSSLVLLSFGVAGIAGLGWRRRKLAPE